MKRLIVGLTLLLMAFLSSLGPGDALHPFASRAGVQRWMMEMALALVVVAAFAHRSQLRRRMLFPRRGLRLLLAGITLHALALAIMTGALVRIPGVLPLEPDSVWAALLASITRLQPLPLLVLAQVLLLVGAFRALTNLVPPDEFAADF
jgi:hypothetical protein